MLDLAASLARDCGLEVVNLGDLLQGEARDVAKALAGIARSTQLSGRPCSAPALILSGGELTVTVRGEGQGGPNQEFALAMALALDGRPGIHAISCDTDGIDGNNDAAGAVIGPASLKKGKDAGEDAEARLKNNDAGGWFDAIGDIVRTGPTFTNVNDFRAILVLPEA